MALYFNVAKVNSLPTTLAASTLYIIPNANSTYIDMYVSDINGTTAKKIVGVDDIATISTSVTASSIGLGNVDNTSDLDKPISTATQAALDSISNSLKVYSDYPSLINSTTPTSSALAFVKDVSSDGTLPTGSSGYGIYVWDATLTTPAWAFKFGQKLDWSDLTNIPVAVSSLGDSSGQPTYGGVNLLRDGDVAYVNIADEAW